MRRRPSDLPFFTISGVCALACMLFVDFGWRAPYVIASAWLSAAFLVFAGASLVVDALYRIEEVKTSVAVAMHARRTAPEQERKEG